MESNESKVLLDLCEVVRKLGQGQRVSFVFNKVSDTESTELKALGKDLENLCNQYNENYNYILGIAKGDLNVTPPARNSFANPYKQLQSDLLHLTWQIQQISQGDYEQKVSFSGDFSDSINKMIESLREKQRIGELNEKYVEELKELNAMKDKFFSIIAHDLKNPFTGLLSLSDLLLNNIREKDYTNLEEYAALLKEFSEQGYRLLLNLLEWSRANTNSIKICIEPLSLARVVDESRSAIMPSALQKKIAIECSCSHDYSVMADVNLLNTVLRNLLSNAVKFSNENGVIRISGEETDHTVTVHVADNGVGIKPEILSKLFRIDTNCSTKGTRNEEGTGLGLILCKDFLGKMGGTIDVTSEWGKGTTFSFTLPKNIRMTSL